MNDFNNDNAQPSMEEHLTAFLMGEADAVTSAAVQAALAVDPDLRARRDSIEHTLDLIKQTAPLPGSARLNDTRRAALREAAAAQLRPRSWRPTSLLSAAALLLLVGGLAYINRDTWMPAAEPVHAGIDSAPLEQLHSIGYSSAYAADSEAGSELNALGYVGDDQDFATTRGRDDLRGKRLRKEAQTATDKDAVAYRPVVVLPSAEAPSPSSPSSPSSPPSGSSVLRALSGPSTSAPDDRYVAPEGLREYSLAGPRAADDEENLQWGESRRGQYPQPRWVVFDGYGRRYVDQHVLTHLRPAYADESPRDMFFRYYGDNPEVFTKLDSFSTFAADVDSASYPLARNYLVNGQLPPKQSIRTEEFVNYFDYQLAPPQEGDFAVHLQAVPSAFGGSAERTLLAIGIKAREVLGEQRKPMNLVFVIDKSGSMEGARMQLVKDSLELLVDQLREDDTLGIVTFDSNGHEILAPTSARERWKLREAIRNLSTGGSTNAAEGLEMGYKMMETCFSKDRINRLVLASDGVANTGETDQERILKTVRSQAEAEVDLTTLGVGMGNHNDVFLEQLADKGDGSCHYIDDFREAKRVLVDKFLGTMVTVARDVKIQVAFDKSVVLRWRQLGYENRSLADEDFRNDAVDAGEVGSGHEVTALYELDCIAEANPGAKLVTVRLRWFPDGSSAAVEQEYQLDVSAASGRWGLAPPRLRLAGVAAQYAEVLRRSYHAREDSYQTLREEVGKLVRELPGDGDVAELRDMIERTADLARYAPAGDELSVLLETLRGQHLRAAQLRLLGDGTAETATLLAAIEAQNRQIEQRLTELLKD